MLLDEVETSGDAVEACAVLEEQGAWMMRRVASAGKEFGPLREGKRRYA